MHNTLHSFNFFDVFTEVLFPKKRFANIKTHGVSQKLVNSGKQLHKINGLEMFGAKVLDNFCTIFFHKTQVRHSFILASSSAKLLHEPPRYAEISWSRRKSFASTCA